MLPARSAKNVLLKIKISKPKSCQHKRSSSIIGRTGVLPILTIHCRQYIELSISYVNQDLQKTKLMNG